MLQTRNNTSCAKDEVPDNSILRPTAFTSKSLTTAEKRYSNIGREALGILYWLEIFHHPCFVREVSIITDHKPLVAIFKNDIETTVTSTKNTSIQSEIHIKAWIRSIYSRLAIQIKPQRRQRSRNARHADRYQHNTENYHHTRMYDNPSVATSDLPRLTHAVSQGIYHIRLA